VVLIQANPDAFSFSGVLTLGYDFSCLKNAAYHPWISNIFSNFKVMGLMFAAQSIPGLSVLLELLVPKSLFERRLQNFQFLRSLVMNRMASNTTRKDFMSYIIKHAGEKDVKEGEMETNAWSIVIAGSETTATLLDGAIYHLLSNPATMSNLTAEIRSTCKSEKEVRSVTVSSMPYLIAVLDEALRMYPPAPFGLSRVVPPGGATIGNFYLPEGSKASASHWAVFHNEINFADPDSFVPERWLEDREKKYEGDKRDALMPFSAGRRNCIGKKFVQSSKSPMTLHH
jgi:cytochrome P450